MHDRHGHDHGRDRGCGDDHRHHEHRGHGGRDDRGGGDRGAGPDTRFLQLEMSRVLYGEAEGVTRTAFRELLTEAAKGRLRERFGDEIQGLAELAVDELLADVRASLQVEAGIQSRQRDAAAVRDRLRRIFGGEDEE